MKNGSINKNNDQIQNVKSASPIPLSSDDNNKIDTLNMIDRLQIEHPDVCKYSLLIYEYKLIFLSGSITKVEVCTSKYD
jgi:hypothetical protein